MSKYKDIIPKEFYKADHRPVLVDTVGELKEALKVLPDDLPIEQGFGESLRLVVYNMSIGGAHLGFEEWDDE